MKVSAYLRTKEVLPSSYYRVGQYLSNINGIEYKVRTYLKDEMYVRNRKLSNKPIVCQISKVIVNIIGHLNRILSILDDKFFFKPDVIIIQKMIYPRAVTNLEMKLFKLMSKNCNIIWDFDDDIKYSGEISNHEFNYLEKWSKQIITTHEVLKETVNQEYQHKVRLLPTTDISCLNIDFCKTMNERLALYSNEINLIWLGTSANLPNLNNILRIIDDVAYLLKKESGKKIRLLNVSDKGVDYEAKNYVILNINWTRTEAVKMLEIAHIGLMPLNNNKYNKGKGAFKAVQYIGFGLPTIVSNVGFSSKVIDNRYNGFIYDEYSDWKEGLLNLCQDKELWLKMSNNSRCKWESDFNALRIIDVLSELIKGE